MIETDAMGAPIEVADLDAEWLLALAREAATECWKAERRRLRLAAQWCVLHPATEESGFVTWSDTGLPGLCPDEEAALGGEGTPLVAAFTPEPFAAALGVSTLTGLQLLADALDLQHRLPRLWAAVEALAVAPWKARKIAQATHNLSQAAAASVDAQLADRIGSCGWRAIETAVAQAIATYDPHLLETREKHGRDAWGVRLFHRGVATDGADDWVGTSHLEVTGDTLDLTTFHDLVCEQAAQLKALGDTDTLDIRKAKAVGVIANRQATLDLGTLLGRRPVTRPTGPDGAACGQDQALPPPHPDRPARARSRHGDGAGFGTVERFGPATIARIKDWAGRSRVTIQPVLDMARTDAVDAHDPPAWMRELVILRDQHCVFPVLPPGRQSLRSRPHHCLQGERSTRPDPARRPRRPVPTAPPGENLPPMALPPHPVRQLPMDRTPRPDLPGHPDRHHVDPAELSLDK